MRQSSSFRSILLIIFFLISLKSLANPLEFKNFKITGSLIDKKLGLSKFSRYSSVRSVNKEIPNLDEDNTIFDQIVGYLKPRYQDIGQGQANSILQRNLNFNLGKYNNSGFVWQKPMGKITIGVDRQLAPDLFDDHRWIVTDKFMIYVDAFTYLHNLKEDGMIEISDASLAAFAGIVFKREYRYVHMAKNFEDGLTKDFSKLFMSFLKFRNGKFTDLDEYDYVTKEDYLCIKAGVGAHVPLGYGAEFTAGVLAQKMKLASVSLQALGPDDSPDQGELLRISMEKDEGIEVEAELGLELDFYNLLKLTILSYEYTYEYHDIDRVYMSFYEEDIEALNTNTKLSEAVSGLLLFKKVSSTVIAPFVVSREERMKENKQSRFNLLFWGKSKEKQSEMIVINKNGTIKTFFKNYFEQIKYVRGVVETFLNGFTKKLFGESLFSNYKVSRSRKLEMEYENTDIFKEGSPVVISEDQLFILFKHDYQTVKTLGPFYKKYKKYATHFANNYTTLPNHIVNKIDQEKLIGPLKIEVTARISEDGISYFNSQSRSIIYKSISGICSYDRSYRWYQFIKKYKAKKCYKKIKKTYEKYKSEFEISGDLVLWKLKDFLISFNKKSDTKNTIKKLFGESNVFYNGSLKAMIKGGHAPFLTYFTEGGFNGLGIVDSYKREQAIRTPASIVVN